ncbi:MAG: DUF4089 domain-containing protein [Acetobacteraceae bacterium]|nr:DUF4089 domain-containing protein [Acetobacteraceae bacterium]
MSASDEENITARAVDTAAALFGVAMQPEWRAAAMMNFATLTGAAGLVLAFPLEDEAEYGPVFHP